jgi:trimethylamine---corrinoid protein Co-methyltransferase
MAMDLRLKVASESEIALMKDRISEILEKRGMRIDHPELLSYIKKAGAQVDESTRYAKFSRQLQDELLLGMKKEFILAGIDPKNDMQIPHPDGLFYPGSVTGSMQMTEADGTERKIIEKDMPELFQLVEQMDHVNYYSIVTYDDPNVAPETSDVNALYHALNNSTKHGWIQPFDGPNAQYLLDMAAVVVGGKENLAKRPIITPFACVTEPFVIKHMDGEIVCRNAEYGVPTMCCAMPTGGASAPITQPGSVLMAASEVLGLILATQCVKRGLPCIAVPEHLLMDMQSTYALQSKIELQLGRMLSAQLFQNGYGIPVFTWGAGTDAFAPGAESTADVTMTAMTSALSNVTFLQDAGQLECCRRYSPLQLIVDNEIFGMMKILKKGFEINDNTMGFQDIMEMGETPAFISNKHTFGNFRDIFRPQVFNTAGRTKWDEDGRPDLFERARVIYDKFKADFEPHFLPDDTKKELKKVLDRANRELRKN